MDGPKRQRLQGATNDVEDPLNLSARAAAVKIEPRSSADNLAEMRSKFQHWVLETYRDSSKTKTITAKKYERILKTLAGEIKNCAENSKFRFWMKCKGFKLDVTGDGDVQALLVQDKKGEEIKYKKVAVVENFFDIIYDVHVNEGARGIKHAGQKRTHRTITETYAFLPREAVTRFLLCCTDCQKRLNDDRKHSPTSSSCDSTQPHPVDLQDFHTLPAAMFDQMVFSSLAPTPPMTICPCDNGFTPVPNLEDNNNDSRPYDFSSRQSPVSLTSDTIRKQRKRKVTCKIIRSGEDVDNESALDYSSSRSHIGKYAGEQQIPSTKAAEPSTQIDFRDSKRCVFVKNSPQRANMAENGTKRKQECEAFQFKNNGSSLESQCPFMEKISEVLYNPVKFAIDSRRQSNSPTSEDFLEQSAGQFCVRRAVDLLLKARHLETVKESLTENERQQITLKIYSCRIISFLLNYAADVMLRSMVEDPISS